MGSRGHDWQDKLQEVEGTLAAELRGFSSDDLTSELHRRYRKEFDEKKAQLEKELLLKYEKLI